jgi:protein-disulfide isomerase
MRFDRKTSLLLAAGVFLALPGYAADKPKAAAKAAPAPAGAAAVVDGVAITEEDMAKAAGPKWAQFKAQEYAFKRELIDGAIGQKLLENEAAKRKITVAELRQQEVESKTEAVTETQAKEFYEQNRQRFGTLSEPEALDQIQKGLFGQRLQRKLNEYVGTLRSAASVRVLLEPHRIKVDPSDDPAKGPADAVVTIVEFSDFQCPYCARIPPALKRVEETYGKNVRVVFRDFPLLSIHPFAAKAAEAGACAADQGKFWELHDKVFANQQKMAVDDLKAYAKELGMDSTAFDACLDSGKKADEWKADTADGEKYGVSGTPSLFINGRQVPGTPGFEQLAPIIDEELQLKGLPVPPKAPAPVAQAAPAPQPAPATPQAK